MVRCVFDILILVDGYMHTPKSQLWILNHLYSALCYIPILPRNEYIVYIISLYFVYDVCSHRLFRLFRYYYATIIVCVCTIFLRVGLNNIRWNENFDEIIHLYRYFIDFITVIEVRYFRVINIRLQTKYLVKKSKNNLKTTLEICKWKGKWKNLCCEFSR